jgi:hypothetical protein
VNLVQWVESDGNRRVLVGRDWLDLSFGNPLPEGAAVRLCNPVEVLDALINAGYRPTSKAWAAGHVEALEKHVAFAEKVAGTLLENSSRETKATAK